MVAKERYGELNAAFEPDRDYIKNGRDNGIISLKTKNEPKEERRKSSTVEGGKSAPARDNWGSGVEFLMSCIAMSVGLGNIWRFPFTAYENGGGAFLVPYIIVLVLVGKPIYFLEMVVGQFSSKGSVKVYDFSPGMRGSGVGQTVAVTSVMTYYAALMSIIIFYMFASFSSILPWTLCDPEWKDCYPSGTVTNHTNATINLKSSTELYFTRTVLREPKNIDDGLGVPEWRLTLCLLMAWISVYLVLLRGVKSSGKAAYFLAIFPYVVMLILLIRAVTLPGASDGILFFIKPDFAKILEPKVWYAAVTQCFFSLSVCFGNVIMYASYNKFRQNVYRDAMIVTSLDTVTSLLAGFTIFGILGNLAYETGADVSTVVQGGPKLAFISYPEAISKFAVVPQVFSVLFFLMLYVLGIGSNVAMASCIITVVRDKYPKLKHWQGATAVAICGFCVGLVYITPGGQYILTLVDHHGGSFIIYVLGIAELVAFLWIYGIRRVCNDIEFMLGMKIGWYWRICWSIVTPMFLIIVMLYSLATLKQIDYNGVQFPKSALTCGWMLSIFGIMQVPIFAGIAIYKRREIIDFKERIVAAFGPKDAWGPTDPQTKREWLDFNEEKRKELESRLPRSKLREIYDCMLGY